MSVKAGPRQHEGRVVRDHSRELVRRRAERDAIQVALREAEAAERTRLRARRTATETKR